MVAVADFGEYGNTKKTIFVDGKPKEVPADKTPDDKRPLWMPWVLERAFLCEQLNWRVLPDQIDDCDVKALKAGVSALSIMKMFQVKARDLKQLTEGQIEAINHIEKLRDLDIWTG